MSDSGARLSLLEIFGVWPRGQVVHYLVVSSSSSGAQARAAWNDSGGWARGIGALSFGEERRLIGVGSQFHDESSSKRFVSLMRDLDKYLGSPVSSERIFVEKKVLNLISGRWSDQELANMARIACQSVGVYVPAG